MYRQLREQAVRRERRRRQNIQRLLAEHASNLARRGGGRVNSPAPVPGPRPGPARRRVDDRQ